MTDVTPIHPITREYWSNPDFAARLDAERDAVLAAYWGSIDARRRASQEVMWLADEHNDLQENGL